MSRFKTCLDFTRNIWQQRDCVYYKINNSVIISVYTYRHTYKTIVCNNSNYNNNIIIISILI